MPTKPAFPCAACGLEFGSRWALTEHDKTCPVKRNAELRRVQESLDTQLQELQGRITLMFGWAARSFANYHAEHLTHARLFHQWITDDLGRAVQDAQRLSQAIQDNSRIHFPFLSKVNKDVGLVIEQLADLTMILQTLTSAFGSP